MKSEPAAAVTQVPRCERLSGAHLPPGAQLPPASDCASGGTSRRARELLRGTAALLGAGTRGSAAGSTEHRDEAERGAAGRPRPVPGARRGRPVPAPFRTTAPGSPGAAGSGRCRRAGLSAGDSDSQPGRAAMALPLPDPPWPASLASLKVRAGPAGRWRPGAGDAAGERPAGQPGRRRSRAGTAPRSAGRAGDPAAAQGPAGSARSSGPARASPQRAAVRYRLAVPRGAHSPGSAGPLRPLPPRPAVTPVPLQALDDLLRCGICYDYYNIAMIIPQCSHNCEYGRSERRAPGSAPVRPAVSCASPSSTGSAGVTTTLLFPLRWNSVPPVL